MQEIRKGFQESLSQKEGNSGVQRRDSDPRRSAMSLCRGEDGEEPQSHALQDTTEPSRQ